MKAGQDDSKSDSWFAITILALVVINIVAWLIVIVSLILTFNILFSGDFFAMSMGIFLTALAFIYVAFLILLLVVLVDSWRKAD